MKLYNPESKLSNSLSSIAVFLAFLSIVGTVAVLGNYTEILSSLEKTLLIQNVLDSFIQLNSTLKSILVSVLFVYLGTVMFISTSDTTQLTFDQRSTKAKVVISAVKWIHYVIPLAFVVYSYWILGSDIGFYLAALAGFTIYFIVKQLGKRFINLSAVAQIPLLAVSLLVVHFSQASNAIVELFIVSAMLFYLRWLKEIVEEFYSENTEIENILNRIRILKEFEGEYNEFKEISKQVKALVKQRKIPPNEVIFSKLKEMLEKVAEFDLSLFLRKPSLYIGSHLIIAAILPILLWEIEATVIPAIYLIAVLPLSLTLLGVLRFNPQSFYEFEIADREKKISAIMLEKNEVDGYYKILTSSDEKITYTKASLVSYKAIEGADNILRAFGEKRD